MANLRALGVLAVLVLFKTCLSHPEPEDPCFPYHDCTDANPQTLHCRCDDDCEMYGDCCPNHEPVTKPPKMASVTPETLWCASEGIYMVEKCPTNQTVDDNLQNKCGRFIMDSKDIHLRIPVIDTISGVTFVNRYCAQCHGVDPNTTLSWDMKIECTPRPSPPVDDSFDEEILETLVYNKDTFSWGYWEPQFMTCNMFGVMPRPTKSFTYRPRKCHGQFPTFCMWDWEDEEIARKCRQDLAPVFHPSFGGASFKNIHCAVCNNVSLEELTCFASQSRTCGGGGGISTRGYDAPGAHGGGGQNLGGSGYGGGASGATPSLRLLVDWNRTGGKRVGHKVECGEGQETFDGKCQTLTCGFPGYSMVGDTCVRNPRRKARRRQ